MLHMIRFSLYAAQARGCYAASACPKITKSGEHYKQSLPSNTGRMCVALCQLRSHLLQPLSSHFQSSQRLQLHQGKSLNDVVQS